MSIRDPLLSFQNYSEQVTVTRSRRFVASSYQNLTIFRQYVSQTKIEQNFVQVLNIVIQINSKKRVQRGERLWGWGTGCNDRFPLRIWYSLCSRQVKKTFQVFRLEHFWRKLNSIITWSSWPRLRSKFCWQQQQQGSANVDKIQQQDDDGLGALLHKCLQVEEEVFVV